jgi:OmpA-OmpF porin, OOP family
MKKSQRATATHVAAIAVIGLVVSTAAHAQYNDDWYVMPSVQRFTPVSGFDGLNKRGTGYGVKLGKPLSELIDIQLGLNSARTSQDGGTYRQTLLDANALFLFSRDAFRPFVSIGAGIARDNVSFPGDSQSKTSPELNAGLGFQYGFTKSIGMQLDFRRAVSFVRNNNGFADRSRINNNYVGLGLTIAFGGPAKPLPPVKAAPPPAPEPVATPPAPVVAPPPAPPAPPPPAPKFERITLSNTELFTFDRAELKSPQPKLDEIAAALNANAQIGNITVSGHTDRLGSDKYNMALSQRRAEAVKTYLVAKGVSASRINAVGKGEGSPVVQCAQKNRKALIACLAPNRRVEVEQISFERRVQ